MRIGVDGACLANGRGYGRFTRELLRALLDAARDHRVRGLRRSRFARRAPTSRRRTSRIVHVAPERLAGAAPPPLTAIARRSTCCDSRAPSGAIGPTCSGRRRCTRTSRCRRDCPRSSRSTTRSPSVSPSSRCRRVALGSSGTPRCASPSGRRRSCSPCPSSRRARSRRSSASPRARLRVAGEAAARTFRPGTASGGARGRARGRRARRRALVHLRRRIHPAQVRRPHRPRARRARRGSARAQARPVPYLVLVGTTSADNFHGVGAGIHEAIAAVRHVGLGAVDGLHARRDAAAPAHGHRGARASLGERRLRPARRRSGGVRRAGRRDDGESAAAAARGRRLLRRAGRHRGARRRRCVRSSTTRERERLGAVALERAARLTWRASARATLAALDDVVAIGAPRRSRARRLVTPLRFCMVTTFYPPRSFGGDAVAVQSLARALVRAGHDVTVICDDDAYRTLSRQRAMRRRRKPTTASSSIACAARSAPSPSRSRSRPAVPSSTDDARAPARRGRLRRHPLSQPVARRRARRAGVRRRGQAVHRARALARLPDARALAPSRRAVHRPRVPAMPAAAIAVRRSCGVIRGCSSAISTRSNAFIAVSALQPREASRVRLPARHGGDSRLRARSRAARAASAPRRRAALFPLRRPARVDQGTR